MLSDWSPKEWHHKLTLGSYLEELDRARKEHDLAESRARLCRQLTEIAKAEQETQERLERSPQEASRFADKFEGDGLFTLADFQRLEIAFRVEFSETAPGQCDGGHRGTSCIGVRSSQPRRRRAPSRSARRHLAPAIFILESHSVFRIPSGCPWKGHGCSHPRRADEHAFGPGWIAAGCRNRCAF